MKIGQKIRELRTRKKLTQTELGDLCGWEDAQTRISNYERNRREPTLADMQVIAQNLGVTVLEIIAGAEESYTSKMVSKLLNADEERRNLIFELIESSKAGPNPKS